MFSELKPTFSGFSFSNTNIDFIKETMMKTHMLSRLPRTSEVFVLSSKFAKSLTPENAIQWPV